jgi:hypothetical protein
MTRMVQLEEPGIGPLWVNPDHVRSVGPATGNRTIIEFDNGDEKLVMGQPQRIAILMERDELIGSPKRLTRSR